MESPAGGNPMVLVRAAPGTPAASRARTRLARLGREGRSPTGFLHGPAVLHAVAGSASGWRQLSAGGDVGLQVCSAAWQRRATGMPAAGFELSTLTRFWDRIGSPGRRDWLVLISAAPVDEDDADEMLELVLAGASLELELSVAFAGAGRDMLGGDRFRAWRQLTDFSMARLLAIGDDGPTLPDGVEAATGEELERMRRDADGVLELNE